MQKQDIVKALILASFALIAVGEIFSRYILGLGDPPLWVSHPTIEYMLLPNQDVQRFGNRILVNEYGMRSRNFPMLKQDPSEKRMVLFGDSVVNGGSLIDHNGLASTILEKKMSSKLGKKVTVANISAGSWGPGNWLAYGMEYGFFDADVIVLVISSHDYADSPGFEPLNPRIQPMDKPFMALTELLTRYLPSYLTDLFSSVQEGDKTPPQVGAIKKSMEDLKAFLEVAKNNVANVLVLTHWELEQIEDSEAGDGHKKIIGLCNDLNIRHFSLKPYFRDAITSKRYPYRDYIHPNTEGQKLIAKAILEAYLMTNN